MRDCPECARGQKSAKFWLVARPRDRLAEDGDHAAEARPRPNPQMPLKSVLLVESRAVEFTRRFPDGFRRVAPGAMQIHGTPQGGGEQHMLIARAHQYIAQTRIERRKIAIECGVHRLGSNEARCVANNGLDMIEPDFPRAMREQHELFK